MRRDRDLVGAPKGDAAVRIGIIGVGRAGAVHLQACGSVPGLEVLAICDPAPAARRAAGASGVKTYSDLTDMLETERLDAVSICTPPAEHAPLGVRCLKRGLHLLCEKPLALTTSGAEEMFATARRQGRLLLVASKFRHVGEIMYARELIRSGELGRPASFELSFCSAVDMSRRWNARAAQAGGGVII
ncbi:MAG: Gfo/Idh/MocA family protein, partial [Candidatus Binatia bacterium]